MGKFAGWHIPFLKFMMEIDICYFRIDLHPRSKIFSSVTCWILVGTLSLCYQLLTSYYFNVCS